MTNIITIHSYRGGTGKTNIVANLAYLLTLNGKNVAILDTCIQSPGIHLLFGLKNSDIKHTMNDYLLHTIFLEQAAIEVEKNNPGKLYILPATMKVKEISRLLRNGYDVSILGLGIKYMIKALNLDYLFIDTLSGLHEETFLSMTIANNLLLVFTPDKQDPRGASIMLEVAKKFEIKNTLLIANKIPPSLLGAPLKDKIQSYFDIDICSYIPFYNELLISGSSEIFVKNNPKHKFTLELNKLIKKFI